MAMVVKRPADGRQFRPLNVMDYFQREGLGIQVAFLLPADRAAPSLSQMVEWFGKSLSTSDDHGPKRRRNISSSFGPAGFRSDGCRALQPNSPE